MGKKLIWCLGIPVIVCAANVNAGTAYSSHAASRHDEGGAQDDEADTRNRGKEPGLLGELFGHPVNGPHFFIGIGSSIASTGLEVEFTPSDGGPKYKELDCSGASVGGAVIFGVGVPSPNRRISASLTFGCNFYHSFSNAQSDKTTSNISSIKVYSYDLRAQSGECACFFMLNLSVKCPDSRFEPFFTAGMQRIQLKSSYQQWGQKNRTAEAVRELVYVNNPGVPAQLDAADAAYNAALAAMDMDKPTTLERTCFRPIFGVGVAIHHGRRSSTKISLNYSVGASKEKTYHDGATTKLRLKDGVSFTIMYCSNISFCGSH